jgi:hypothetical protein
VLNLASVRLLLLLVVVLLLLEEKKLLCLHVRVNGCGTRALLRRLLLLLRRCTFRRRIG